MESTVNDFLNEINEIVPLKNNQKKESRQWKECFDSKSGFAYYWNTNTNEVTWEKPVDYITKSPINGPIPNIPVKIYKITPTQPSSKSNGSLPKVVTKKIPERKRPTSDSDDEKITLITSYGSSSESENEEELSKKNLKNEQHEEDILSTVLKRAEELKSLGNVDTSKAAKTQPDEVPKTTKSISGFSLVAGYDSNSDDENEEESSKPATTNPSQTQAHSTLFPIMKTPDIKDFEVEKDIPKVEHKEQNNSFDMKNFKRKRRLGVNFVPNKPAARPPSPTAVTSERKGFGFKENETETAATTTKTLYSNFTKGGVEFIKSELVDSSKKEGNNEVDEKKIVEIYDVLHEKLAFLCEGNKDVMPVQIILIQIETLYGALKAQSLNPEYLHDWLQGTSEDLIKLEKEAAPEGWTLQWDRLEKRYYYHNIETGQNQWEFPTSESDREEEAMDICTTPPPPELIENQIEEGEDLSSHMPSPPPPPIISKREPEIVPESQVVPVVPTNQPLPPGVDFVETTPPGKNDIDSAFNTFYSELAEIEKTSKPGSPTNVTESSETSNKVEEPIEPIKKKRKKMKLGQGLSFKKKDVSKLVEKWKNVQNNY